MSTSIEANSLLTGNYAQFLVDDEWQFVETYGSWSSTGASLAVEKLFRFKDSYNVLKITPSSAPTPPATYTTISLTHEAKEVTQTYATDALTFFAFFYAPANLEVRITVEDDLGNSETSAWFKMPGLKWQLVRGPELRVISQTTSLYFTATVEMRTYGGTSHIHMAHPVLTNTFGFTDNDFVRECLIYMPPILPEVDAEQTAPSFPLARLMDVGLAYADNAFQQSLNFRYVDIEDGYDANDDTTKSTLVNPEVAEPDYLPWLAQFVGVRLETTPGGTTPWKNLPTNWQDIMLEVDDTADVSYTITSISRSSGTTTAVVSASPTGVSAGQTITVTGTTAFNGQYILVSVNTGTNTLTWDDDEASASESSGTITYVDEEWIEIEAYDTSDANFIPGRRDLITTARTGLNAGSKQAILDAITPSLTGTKTINYVTDPFSNPWLITIQTLTSETIGGVTGAQSENIYRAVQPCRPLGFTITHECVASL
jgi:hypothetical protein